MPPHASVFLIFDDVAYLLKRIKDGLRWLACLRTRLKTLVASYPQRADPSGTGRVRGCSSKQRAGIVYSMIPYKSNAVLTGHLSAHTVSV